MEDAYLGGFLHALEKAIFLVLAAAKRVLYLLLYEPSVTHRPLPTVFLVIVCRWAGWENPAIAGI